MTYALRDAEIPGTYVGSVDAAQPTDAGEEGRLERLLSGKRICITSLGIAGRRYLELITMNPGYELRCSGPDEDEDSLENQEPDPPEPKEDPNETWPSD